jgi:tight adherence protein B
MPLDPQAFALFSALAAMLAVVTLVSGASVVREWRSRRSVSEALRELESIRTESNDLPVLRPPEAERPLRRLISGMPGFRGIEDRIAQAGLPWSLESFAFTTTVLALFFGVMLWLVSRSPLAGLAGIVMGLWLPRVHVKRKAKKRIDQLEAQLPGAIDHLKRAVRAGHPLSAGLKMLAEESPEPVASEFRAVFEEQRFGLPFEDALLGLGDRINLPDVRILITAILVQREVGGNLAETLENVGNTMRARFTIRRQVKVYTVQGRMSGYILAALPVLVGLFIFLVNRDYINVLFTHPIGKALLGLAIVLQFVGYLWIRKIVAVEY